MCLCVRLCWARRGGGGGWRIGKCVEFVMGEKKKQTCGDKHKEIYNKLCISGKKKDLIWTFRMFQHTSSEEINR